jgi:hypothetical protein
MISFYSFDVAHSDLGNEVIVLWGNPGTRQKELRAIVFHLLYLNENRNQRVDVNNISGVAGINMLTTLFEWSTFLLSWPENIRV